MSLLSTYRRFSADRRLPLGTAVSCVSSARRQMQTSSSLSPPSLQLSDPIANALCDGPASTFSTLVAPFLMSHFGGWRSATCDRPSGPGLWRASATSTLSLSREFFIDNLLVGIHLIIVMIRWTGLAPWELKFPFPGSLTSRAVRQVFQKSMIHMPDGALAVLKRVDPPRCIGNSGDTTPEFRSDFTQSRPL